MENLDGDASRVLEGDRFLHASGVRLFLRQLLERHAGAIERRLDSLKRGAIAYLPTDVDHPLGVAGNQDHPGRPLVHPQVQR